MTDRYLVEEEITAEEAVLLDIGPYAVAASEEHGRKLELRCGEARLKVNGRKVKALHADEWVRVAVEDSPDPDLEDSRSEVAGDE